jgi:hypothetical protein
MALDSYAGLLSSIAGWLMRDDLTAVIPDFVTLAEADMNARLRLRAMLTTATLDDAGEALPADFMAAKSVHLADWGNLEFATAGELADFDEGYAGGAARWYGIDGDSLTISPAQTGGGTVTLRYYARIPALSDSNTSNHVLVASPALYLYGALAQSAPYLLDDARLQTWGMLYTQAADLLQAADDAAEHPGPLVIRGTPW